MYAIVRDSGQQFKVEEGQELDVDYRQAAKGDEISLGEVLAVGGDDGLKLGRPVVDGATVTAEVLGVSQGPKIHVQKIRRRTHNSRTRTGHRQMYTRVRISKIDL